MLGELLRWIVNVDNSLLFCIIVFLIVNFFIIFWRHFHPEHEHVWQGWAYTSEHCCLQEKKCIECGITETRTEHDTCAVDGSCSRCKEKASGVKHQWSAWSVSDYTHQKECLVCGLREEGSHIFEYCDYIFGGSSQQVHVKGKRCTVCGYDDTVSEPGWG